jgi:hypothetical protein
VTRRISADPRGSILPRASSQAGCGQLADIQFQARTDEGRASPDAGRGRSQHAKRSPKTKKRARLERFPAKWIPVRVKKTRQNKDRASVRIQSERKSCGVPYSVDQVLAELGSWSVQVRRRGNMSTRHFSAERTLRNGASISSGGSIARARIGIGYMERLI